MLSKLKQEALMNDLGDMCNEGILDYVDYDVEYYGDTFLIIIESHEDEEKVDEYLDEVLTDEERAHVTIAFNDGFARCCDCGKLCSVGEGEMYDQAILQGDDFVCIECINELDLITERMNDFTMSIMEEHVNVEEYGFEKFNSVGYENGMYDRVDSPKEIVSRIDTSVYDYVFVVTGGNMFALYFDLYIREKE